MTDSEYGVSVFINCPFDEAYQEFFDAMVFTVYSCNFLPRCAKEADDSSQPRYEKIVDIIKGCKYGIHEISRTEPNEVGLPWFNMPLELGLFLGAKKYGGPKQRLKKCLILDREPLYTSEFRRLLRDSGVKSIRLPRKSPNLNAHAERFVLSVRTECLNCFIPWVKAPCVGPLRSTWPITTERGITRG